MVGFITNTMYEYVKRGEKEKMTHFHAWMKFEDEDRIVAKCHKVGCAAIVTIIKGQEPVLL